MTDQPETLPTLPTEPAEPEQTPNTPNELMACRAQLQDPASHQHRCRLLETHTPLHQCECGAAWAAEL